MFGKFKEKLKKWTKSFSKKVRIKSKEKEISKEKPGTESFFKKIKYKVNKIKISEKEFNIYSEELEMLLLENNVAFEVAEKIIEELKQDIIGKELLKKEIEEEIKESFKKIIKEILIEPFEIINKIKEKVSEKSKEPYVILFCGINGSGKTTSLAKVAESLKKNKISCVMAAGDTFRAASIEQLKEHGEKIGIKVISHDYGSDPASVGFDAIKYAEKNSINCVLIDTAGRIHTSKNLLKEIEKIARVCKPDLKIFVGESITGNDAVEQAKTFNFEIGIDGIILTKADIDEKGGTALSVGYVTKRPILYLGTGQQYDEIEPFDKEKFIERLGL
ncbi:MAG: signal recognition particle-docking protein FtsY [Nanoarchaeota archaeon]